MMKKKTGRISPPLPCLAPRTVPYHMRRFTGLTIEVPPDSSTSEADFDNVSILSNVTDELEDEGFDVDLDEELTPEEEEQQTLEQIRALDERVAPSRRSNEHPEAAAKEEVQQQTQHSEGARSLLSALLDDDAENVSAVQRNVDHETKLGNALLQTPVTPTTESTDDNDNDDNEAEDDDDTLKEERGNAWEGLMSTWQTMRRPSLNSAPEVVAPPLPSRRAALQRRPSEHTTATNNKNNPNSLFHHRLPRQRISAPEPSALRKLAAARAQKHNAAANQNKNPNERGELWQDLVSQWSTLRT